MWHFEVFFYWICRFGERWLRAFFYWRTRAMMKCAFWKANININIGLKVNFERRNRFVCVRRFRSWMRVRKRKERRLIRIRMSSRVCMVLNFSKKQFKILSGELERLQCVFSHFLPMKFSGPDSGSWDSGGWDSSSWPEAVQFFLLAY